MKSKFKMIVAIFALFSFVLLSGCNTAAGFGQDLEKGGQAIKKAAQEASS